MKKVFKLLLYFFSTLFAILLIIIIILNSYYNVLEKRKNAQDKAIEKRIGNYSFSDDSLNKIFVEGPILNLIPVPQKVKFLGSNFRMPSNLKYSVADSLRVAVHNYLLISGLNTIQPTPGDDIIFRYKEELPLQGYNMDIRPDRITVEYSTRQGLYYALVSLKVLNYNYNGVIPCVYIEDYPDLAVRGLMLDISRNKIPKPETLKGIVQLLADLKYNHFELYIEGFSFAYPSFRELWEGKETPLTGEEIQALGLFCKNHFIDLVPNQNSLGHMMAWLETDQFSDLAECPGGYKILGLIEMKGTINPTDPRSIELVAKMTDDLLPNFSSDNFNVNLDEPFELGQGKSKKIAKEKGFGEVYLDYALKIHEMVTGKKKSMLMWADIVLKHPEILPEIPTDITLLDWGYEAEYPFEKNSKTFQSEGLKYMVCPGTSTWTTITGRTDNMLKNIEAATTAGVKYGSEGMLLTDWGDMGHWQYLPVSYAGYTTGASLSWNYKSRNTMPLAKFLNSYVFRDENRIMGNLVLDLGRYLYFEEVPIPNMTTTMLALQFGLRDRIMINAIYETIRVGLAGLMNDIAPEMIEVYNTRYDNRHLFDYQGLINFLDDNEELLLKVNIQTPDSQLIIDEYSNAFRLLRVGVGLQDYIENRAGLSIDEQKSGLEIIRSSLVKYLDENRRLWDLRNKPGGYEKSTEVLVALLQQIDDRLALLERSSFNRRMSRFFEKAGTAGAVLYMRVAAK